MKNNGLIKKDCSRWEHLSNQLRSVREKISLLQAEKDMLEEAIIDMCHDQDCFGSGMTVSYQLRKGAVQYKKIPELFGVDLDKYRGDYVGFWQFKFEGEKVYA